MKTASEVRAQIEHLQHECRKRYEPETIIWIEALEWTLKPSASNATVATALRLIDDELEKHKDAFANAKLDLHLVRTVTPAPEILSEAAYQVELLRMAHLIITNQRDEEL